MGGTYGYILCMTPTEEDSLLGIYFECHMSCFCLLSTFKYHPYNPSLSIQYENRNYLSTHASLILYKPILFLELNANTILDTFNNCGPCLHELLSLHKHELSNDNMLQHFNSPFKAYKQKLIKIFLEVSTCYTYEEPSSILVILNFEVASSNILL